MIYPHEHKLPSYACLQTNLEVLNGVIHQEFDSRVFQSQKYFQKVNYTVCFIAVLIICLHPQNGSDGGPHNREVTSPEQLRRGSYPCHVARSE